MKQIEKGVNKERKMIGMKKSKIKFFGVVIVALVLCLTVTPVIMRISAAGGMTEAELNSKLAAETSAQKAALAAAVAEGVKVDGTTNATTKIHGTNAAAVSEELERIKEFYAQQLIDIQAAKALQESYNETFKNKQEEEFKKLISSEWTSDDLAGFIGDSSNYLDAVIINKQLDEMILDPGTLEADATGKMTKLKTGDTFTYEKVLVDPKTGSKVDFKFTVVKILDSITKVEVLETSYGGSQVVKENEMYFRYGNHDVTLKVQFIDHDTGELLFINPIVAIVDIDAGQSVRINSPAVKSCLWGSELEEEDGLISSDIVDYSPSHKPNWALFNLIADDGLGISEFTYTFYDDGGINKSGVEQGLGSNALKFDSGIREFAHLDITYRDMELYYLAEYTVLPDAKYGMPADAGAVADTAEYKNGAIVSLKDTLTTTWKSIDGTAAGQKGTWMFSGWYNNSKLEGNAVLSEKIVDDDVRFYGKWTFIESSEPSAPFTGDNSNANLYLIIFGLSAVVLLVLLLVKRKLKYEQ